MAESSTRFQFVVFVVGSILSLALIEDRLDAQDYLGVRIDVYQTPARQGVTYSYRVVNNYSKPIVSVGIGLDSFTTKRLRVGPVGFGLGSGPLPASSYESVRGWTARFDAGSDTLGVLFFVTPDQASAIGPGETVGWFRVTVPEAEAEYGVNGKFTVLFSDGAQITYFLTGVDPP